ncbi:MAG: TIGR03663 family protein [Methanomicrobiales archaeon]|nr:TIGR03663 family protein [Methanomicrobiales archaeon]
MNAAEIAAWIRSKISFQTLFLAIFAIALFVRLWSLDLRLFHHDEAVHAWFAYHLLSEGTYVYDPSYHGPFLYYVTAGMFSLFGDADLVGRILPALFGIALIPMVYAIYRLGYLDQKQTLVASLFIALSPELVYFSRFLRHDIFQLTFTLLLLVALLYYHSSGKLRYAALAGLSAGLGMTLKEDMPILLAIFLVYGLYLLWSGKVTLHRSWKWDGLVAGVFFVGTMLLFYSSFGVHPEVILGHLLDPGYIQQNGIISAFNQTGWYQAVEHWVAMHDMCRICGPWFFYFMLLILYELPILVLAVLGIVQFTTRGSSFWFRFRDRLWKSRGEIQEPPFSEVVQRVLRGINPPAGDTRKEEFMRFSIIWMLGTLAAYAYIGEKVPWLVIHQLLPLIFVATYLMTTRKTLFAVLSTIFLILVLWHVSFAPTDINEPIVQVQNSEDLRTVMALIDASDKVVVSSDNYWPLPWYYRGERTEKLQYYGYLLPRDTLAATNADLIITYDADSYESLAGYDKYTYKINYWFSYYDVQNSLLEYYFLRDGKLGSMNFDVFVRSGSALPAQVSLSSDHLLFSLPTPNPYSACQVSSCGTTAG